MQLVKTEYKGKEERHVLLDPEDVTSLFAICIFSKNALRSVPPWDNKEQHETYAKVIEWFSDKVKTTQLS